MDINQITGPLRAIVPALTAYAVGKGWIPEGDYTTAMVSIVTGVAAIWSFFSNKPKPAAA
jgi:hypothetical protein